MTYRELLLQAELKLDHNDITLGEFEQMIAPLNREIDRLDKIRAEIEQAADKQFQIAMGVADLNERYTHIQMENAYRHSLNIIDKYTAEVEPQERSE